MIREFDFKTFSVSANSLEEAKKFLEDKRPDLYEEYGKFGKEKDYDKCYCYFPISEIKECDLKHIYDYKRKGLDDEVASLPLSIAMGYESYIKKQECVEYPRLCYYYV